MIPAPRGFLASYKEEIGGKSFWTHKALVGWNDDGEPLVVNEKTGTLYRADWWSNFDGVRDASLEPGDIVAMIPGGGWLVEYTQDDGTKTTWQILAWGLKANGEVVPLDVDGSGLVLEVEDKKARVFHSLDGEGWYR